MRSKFETLRTPGRAGYRQSRRGTYQDPAMQRDWKWFQAGYAQAVADVTDRLEQACGATAMPPVLIKKEFGK